MREEGRASPGSMGMLEPIVTRMVAQIFEGGVGAGIAEDVEIELLLNEARAEGIEIGEWWDDVGEVGLKVEGADEVVAEMARGEGESGGGSSGGVEGESGEEMKEEKEEEGRVLHLLQRLKSNRTNENTFTCRQTAREGLVSSERLAHF